MKVTLSVYDTDSFTGGDEGVVEALLRDMEAYIAFGLTKLDPDHHEYVVGVEEVTK